MMLISPNGNGLNHPSLINIFYDKHATDPYCVSKEINDIFMKSLRAIGYNVNDTSELTFTDKSD